VTRAPRLLAAHGVAPTAAGTILACAVTAAGGRALPSGLAWALLAAICRAVFHGRGRA
jgi:hypothetical protein